MKKMMIATLAAASVLLAVANQAHAGATLDAVQKKGFVQCGISCLLYTSDAADE